MKAQNGRVAKIYSHKRGYMNEVKISDSSNREAILRVHENLIRMGTALVDESDAEQIGLAMDQAYIDYILSGKKIIVHSEHYLGIYLLSKEISQSDLVQMAHKLNG